jgi:copper(I)-binding protein
MSVALSRALLRVPGALLTLVVVLAGCGSSSRTASAPERGPRVVVGALTLSAPRVPLPASPDVGVAYFVLTNNGVDADDLVAASSPQARSVVPMRDVTRGGASTMVAVPRVTVPAHGRVTLEPGGLHLMLRGLTGRLAVGDQVRLRLRFADAGLLRVTIPVTPLADLTEPSDTGSMAGM